jgi:hypothetical protein
MRVSSLSNERVIALVSKYFVPAWASRDGYQLANSRAEREELLRIDRERRHRGLEGGNVCVYILDPDGALATTLPVQRASKPENLVPFLEKIIADRHLEPRNPEAIRAGAARRATPKPAAEGAVRLHVWTRMVDAEGNRGVSQDRVELAPDEWAALVPAADARQGDSWAVPEKIVHKLYRYCYPPGPHWDARDCKVQGGTLKATLAASSREEAEIRLQGELKLAFPATGKPTDGKVTAKLVGMAHYDRGRKVFTSLVLASEEAEYVWYWQGQPQPRKMLIAVELEP